MYVHVHVHVATCVIVDYIVHVYQLQLTFRLHVRMQHMLQARGVGVIKFPHESTVYMCMYTYYFFAGLGIPQTCAIQNCTRLL